MQPITVLLLGAGQRGEIYTDFALNHPMEMKLAGVADPNEERRNKLRMKHGLAEEACFSRWQDALDGPIMADAVIICTQDTMHYEPAMKALERGYHVLLEKPMSTTPEQCVRLAAMAERSGKVLSICHVLRYAPFFTELKKLVTEGRIGELVSIQHNENVGYWHYAHSYVRGNWNNSHKGSPMILAKSSHDVDIIKWLADAECTRVSSFGSLTYFKPEHAPEGAPNRCLDGCPAAGSCEYYAPDWYLPREDHWTTSAITDDRSREGIYHALQHGPYGRCVYRSDNNVVDHQVVNMEYSNGITVAFTMCAFTKEPSRTLKLMGTKGEIRAAMEKNEIEVIPFGTSKKEVITFDDAELLIGHGGGDMIMVRDFIRLVRAGGGVKGRTDAQQSLDSHLICFAAEQARVTGSVIDMKEYAASFG